MDKKTKKLLQALVKKNKTLLASINVTYELYNGHLKTLYRHHTMSSLSYDEFIDRLHNAGFIDKEDLIPTKRPKKETIINKGKL